MIDMESEECPGCGSCMEEGTPIWCPNPNCDWFEDTE